MTRVKGATHAIKRRRSLLSKVKGYRNARSTKERQAKQAWIRAGQHSFAHRRRKKADLRGLWQTRISAAVSPHGVSYSRFIDSLKKNNIAVDRKILAEIARENPETFQRIVEKVKS